MCNFIKLNIIIYFFYLINFVEKNSSLSNGTNNSILLPIHLLMYYKKNSNF